MSVDKVSSALGEQLAADAWQTGTYEWWPSADRVIWSPELIRIYGLKEAPAAEACFTALVHPDDRVRVEGETSSYLGSGVAGYSHVFRIVRPDGGVRIILDRGAIERDAAGRVDVIRGINIDVTGEAGIGSLMGSGQRVPGDQQILPATAGPPDAVGPEARTGHSADRDAADDHLRTSEDRYRTLFEAIDQGFCVLELRLSTADAPTDYRVVEANPAFYDRTGFPEAILGQWLREAAPDLEEHWYETYGRVARTGEPIRFEQQSEMLGRWFNVYAFRIGARQGHRVAVLFNDITGRKSLEEQNRMLMLEAHHRSKNMLGLVQAIARQTASSGADDFIVRFIERVQALSAAQDLLFRNSWKTAPLADLVQSQLAHFADLVGERIEIAGPSLSLTPEATRALGMALHELATNAAKYGALSNATGCVAITWVLEPGASAVRTFTLSWQESGGPPVVMPERSGFGSRLTTGMVEASTGGQVWVDFAPAGLSWRLSCPHAGIVAG